MFRISVTAAFLAAFVTQVDAAPITDWKDVAIVLDAIPSAAGMSVLKRIDKCHVKIDKTKSWVETRAVDWPEYGARAGETVLLIMMKLPASGGAPPSMQQGTKAIWLISRGKPISVNAWAQQFQSRPIPMGYDSWMNC